MRSFLYPAPPVAVPSPPPPPLAEETLRSADGTSVVAWSLASSGAGGSLVYFHGNGENLETLRRGGLFDALAGCGRSVLAVDYPGYGRSGGVPSEDAIGEVARRAFDRLGALHAGEPRAIVGWSLGAAAAVALAAERPNADRLVLLSPWASLGEVARVHFPGFLVEALLAERWDSLAAAPRVTIPALVMHGARDDIIPAAQGRRLAAALGGPTRWVEVATAGHNDLLAESRVWDEVRAFLGVSDGPASAAAGAGPVP